MATKNSIEIIIQKINQSRKEIDELKQQILAFQERNKQLEEKVKQADPARIEHLEKENKALKEELESRAANLIEVPDPAGETMETAGGKTYKAVEEEEHAESLEEYLSIQMNDKKEKKGKKGKKEKKEKKDKKKKNKKKKKKDKGMNFL